METLLVEKFHWEKCIFTLLLLKTQVRVFFNDCYYFFASF